MSIRLAVSFLYLTGTDAKAGGIPFLAVGTEQGTVHILNTSRREDWNFGIYNYNSFLSGAALNPINFRATSYNYPTSQ